MNAVFRVDASRTIGTGHVMRCLTLASALRERDAAVSFICRQHEGHLCDLIEEREFTVSRLAAPAGGFQPQNHPAHAAWLGVSLGEDAAQTCALIESTGTKPDWLVVDHYALDRDWEQILRPSVSRIMVIDDLADRMHDCDLLLDQNLVAQMHTRYADKVPATCGLLLGPQYALLQPIYAELHDRMPPREGPIQRILIFFGGTDGDNLTGRSLAAFLGLNRPDIVVDVVIAASCWHAEAVRKQAAEFTNIRVHSDLDSLAPLIARADLALGAAGATSWERLCLGLPTLVVTVAENQRAIADELGKHGLIRCLGHHDMVDKSTIARALDALIENGLDEEGSLRCLGRVDGKGANRVCAALTVTEATPLRVRNAEMNDETLLLEWANDPATRGNVASTESIDVESHRRWFRKSLCSIDECHLYVVETAEGVAIGQVRFEHVERAWEVHFALAPVFRGRGLGSPVLEAALLRLRVDLQGALIVGQGKGGDNPWQQFELLELERQPDPGSGQWCINVCSDEGSWINTCVPELLVRWLAEGSQVAWAHEAEDLPAGDMCFYLSYGQIVGPELLARQRNNLVVHASDLPKGRGWSPLTWQILEGKSRVSVTLFEATEEVDSGPIYEQVSLEFSGLELIDELRDAVSGVTRNLCRRFVRAYPTVAFEGIPQKGEPTFYVRRFPRDSQLDIERPLREQFNLLRTVDSERYPAWFEIAKKRFVLKIEESDV